jgi:hypothetical protein
VRVEGRYDRTLESDGDPGADTLGVGVSLAFKL